MKISRKISKLKSKIALKRLSKVAFVLKSDDYVKYIAPGPKTNGYLNPWETIRHAINVVYNDSKFFERYIQGIRIEENEHEINVKVFTSRPGMLIGKQGFQIEDFEKILTDVFLKNTSINLEENHMNRWGMQKVELY
jgi:ribosomal protein S3